MEQNLNSENLKIGYDKASYLCSRREYCEADMYTKLLQWKLSADEANFVIRQLVIDKFIDNERYTKAFVRDKSKFSAWGAIKIKMALRTKKIDEALIQVAIADLPNDQFYQQALKEGSKKYRGLRDEDVYAKKQKLVRFLFSKGFESSLVWKVVAVITSTPENDMDDL